MELDTLPKYLEHNYQKWGSGKVAVRKKTLGIWNEYTWEDCYRAIKHLTLGLMSLGLKEDERVSIIGDNCPEWFWTQYAAQAAGGVAVGIFADAPAQEIKYILDHSDSKFAIVKDQEQVDKLLEMKGELSKLEKVICWDPTGMRDYDEPILMTFDEVLKKGRKYDEEHPELFSQKISQGKRDDTAVMCYTSGTTTLPKGALLSHGNLISCCLAWNAIDRWYDSDEYVSIIPPAWVGEQGVGVTGWGVCGFTVNFAEEPETVQQDAREIGPNILWYGAPFWESVVSTMQAKIEDTTALKRAVYKLFLPVGYEVNDFQAQGRNPPLLWRVLHALANVLVFRPLKDKHGLLYVRTAFSGGAPLSPEALKMLRSLGINIKQGLGHSEAVFVAIHRDEKVKPETVGEPLPGIEFRISEDGEILEKGPTIFAGYHKAPELSLETLRHSWFYTGDAGYIDDDGQLIVIDRLSALTDLAGGGKFSPQFIETRLRFSPYIKDIMAIGGRERPYVTALVNIDFQNAGKWAEKKKIPYTTFTDLSQRPEIYDLVQKDMAKVNLSLPEPSRIRKYALLHKEFDADEAELTRTKKLRRDFIEQRYGDLIAIMYQDQDEALIDSEIKYRDGRIGKIKTALKIRTVGKIAS